MAVATLQCESLEGNYRSPQRNHWDSLAPSKLPAPDTADAWDVALAIATLAAKYHLVLKLCHVARIAGHRLDDRTVATTMRALLRQKITPSDIAPTESMAKVMLGDALMFPVKHRRESTVAKARQLIGQDFAMVD